jgi:hypothetical protein
VTRVAPEAQPAVERRHRDRNSPVRRRLAAYVDGRPDLDAALDLVNAQNPKLTSPRRRSEQPTPLLDKQESSNSLQKIASSESLLQYW